MTSKNWMTRGFSAEMLRGESPCPSPQRRLGSSSSSWLDESKQELDPSLRWDDEQELDDQPFG